MSTEPAVASFGAAFQRTRAWFERAAAGGWLDEAALQRLATVENGTPGDLFAAEQGRPLVVAFFGGTGVGKSSLLNRLAAAPLARTGVARPTSLETDGVRARGGRAGTASAGAAGRPDAGRAARGGGLPQCALDRCPGHR